MLSSGPLPQSTVLLNVTQKSRIIIHSGSATFHVKVFVTLVEQPGAHGSGNWVTTLWQKDLQEEPSWHQAGPHWAVMWREKHRRAKRPRSKEANVTEIQFLSPNLDYEMKG